MRALTLLALLAGLPPDGDDASHFPLIVGSRWVYRTQELRWNTRVGEPGPAREGPPRGVVCAEDKDGLSLRSPDAASRYVVTRDGVYQGSVDAANLILKFPLRKFDEWGPGDRKNGLSRFSNHGQMDVEVAGTKVHCWKIREQRVLPKGLRTCTRCYAPGLGLVSEEVREEVEGMVTQRSSVLETYEKEPGKK